MPRYRQSRARYVAMMPMLLALTACQTWHARPRLDNAQQEAYQHAVRVSLVDGSVVTLTNARVEGDSLVGRVQWGTADTTTLIRSFPIRTVTKVEERGFSPARTFGLLVGSVTAAWALLTAAWLVAFASWGGA